MKLSIGLLGIFAAAPVLLALARTQEPASEVIPRRSGVLHPSSVPESLAESTDSPAFSGTDLRRRPPLRHKSTSLAGSQAEAAPEPPRVVVGTFDSRAVAVAYAASEHFEARTKEWRTRLAEAKAAGDEERAAVIEAEAVAQQALFHRQAFCAAPVDDILQVVEARLAAVGQEGGVDVLVSKWALAWEAPGAELVDLTEAMARLFDPGEQTWRHIRALKDVAPVSVEELEGHER